MTNLDEMEQLAKAAVSSGLPGDRMMFALKAMDPEGILALIAEVRALRESGEDWKRRWQDAVDRASALTIERNHWQANHDNQVARARFLIERGDIPVERVRAYGLMGALLELEEAIRHDREMFAETSDEFNPTGTLVTSALAAIDAARGAK
jgi:hypothetical protein